jgi:F-type H+-transporting ATPase subunit epsilon
VTTPSSIVVDAATVRHVRAEDETGAFGLLPHHTDLLAVLAISVVTWRDEDEREHHVAVRGGVLTTSGGERVEIATREAQASDDLDALEREVLARYRAEAEATAAAATEAARLEAALVHQVLRYLGERAKP